MSAGLGHRGFGHRFGHRGFRNRCRGSGLGELLLGRFRLRRLGRDLRSRGDILRERFDGFLGRGDAHGEQRLLAQAGARRLQRDEVLVRFRGRNGEDRGRTLLQERLLLGGRARLHFDRGRGAVGRRRGGGGGVRRRGVRRVLLVLLVHNVCFRLFRCFVC